jgi:hypothetical protein
MLTRCPSPGNFHESLELPQTPDIIGAYWYVLAKDKPPIPGWKYNGSPGPLTNGLIIYKARDGKWVLDYLMLWLEEIPLAGKLEEGDYATLRELLDLGTMDVYEELRPLLPALVNAGQLSSAEFSRYEHAFFKHINQDEVPLEETTV